MKAMVGGCCVCSDETGWKDNPLVYCDGHGCTVAVHQACYGIISVPSGPWFCRKCNWKSQNPTAQVRCQLCPLKDGALKKTVPEGWCHVLCALYIPEAAFEDVQTMEPILLERVRPDRFGKVCYICEEQKRDPTKINYGACIRCRKAGCQRHFHITCAQSQGLLCEASGGRGGNVKYVAYCLNHLRKLKDSSVKVIPAFTAAPAESASSDSSPEKREREPFKLPRGKKTCGKSGFTCMDSTPSFTDVMDVQEASSATKCVEAEKLNHRSASQKSWTPKSASTVCSCKQLCTCSENLSNVSLVDSASDSRPGSSTNVASSSSENVFTTFRSDSLLNTGSSSSSSSGGIFGSAAAVNRDSGSAQQSVIVSSESDLSNSQSLPSTSTQGSTAETAEPKQLYSKTSTSGGSVFGGGPFFQRPPFLSALPSEGESSNGAPTFAHPLPPASPTSPLLSESQDNGRVPHSILELLQLQQEDTLKLLLDKSSNGEAAEMLEEVSELKGQNRELEDEVATLMKHRDSLLSINANLAIPLANAKSTPDPPAWGGPEPVSAAVTVAHLPSSSSAKNDGSYIEESIPHIPEAVKTPATSQTAYLGGQPATDPYSLQGSARLLEHPSVDMLEVTQQQCMAPSGWMASKQPNNCLWTSGSEGATEQPWTPVDQCLHKCVT